MIMANDLRFWQACLENGDPFCFPEAGVQTLQLQISTKSPERFIL